MNRISSTNYGLMVNLTDPEANAITTKVESGESAVEKLSGVAAGLLRDLAHGGTMIAPEWADRIQAAIGTNDPSAIVSHVEKAVNRQGEAVVVNWVVDPTHIAFYKSMADNAGISLDLQLKSLMDYAYAQGVFNMAAPDPFKLLLTHEQYRTLQEMFAKDVVTGQDVINLLRSSMRSKPTAAPPEEEDFVLDALTRE